MRESRVLSNQVIDFHLRDGRVMRNTLPHSCPQLGFERAFSSETSLSQRCNGDIITVIVQAGGPTRGASCGLGPFQPGTLAKKKGAHSTGISIGRFRDVVARRPLVSARVLGALS